jgi:ubiquitin-conjugating enzyme E2 Q
MVYTNSDDVPESVTAGLEDLQNQLFGLSVGAMLQRLADQLERALAPASGASSFTGSDQEFVDVDDAMEVIEISDDDDDQQDEELEYSDGEDEWFPQSPAPQHEEGPFSMNNVDDAQASELIARLAADLTKAKLAGFKVGYLGNKTSPIVCVSSRLSKLGISEEAMKAWGVEPRQYLVCLIRYTGRYRSLEEILREDEALGKTSVEVYVDLCDSYKPTLESAVNAFIFQTSNDKPKAASGAPHARQITRSFISKPLNSLLRERFIKILRCRYSYGFDWHGAERFFNDIQGKSLSHVSPSDDQYLTGESAASSSTALPPQVTADHLIEGLETEKSFPLIAMQFALRHFVRCTEFCLVCHCKTDDAFEALKPYVCSKNLCLFQYMSLGFGPSIEWEIQSQPYVVDLLISFTYASAKQGRLDDFPTGLGFLVPDPAAGGKVNASASTAGSAPGNPVVIPSSNKYEAVLDRASMELIFANNADRPISTGDWIIILNPRQDGLDLHCRVKEGGFYPTVQLGEPVTRSPATSIPNPQYNNNVPRLPAPRDRAAEPPTWRQKVTFQVYDRNFDELKVEEQRAVLPMLLDLLPSVSEMRDYLVNGRSNPQRVLADWRERIPKSALDVLRWIIASNRSCIIQENPDSANYGEDSVFGVDNYMQFRFAQGAPDKEQRFIQSVAATTASPTGRKQHPTLFAWHGSPLSNWHSIVREGLHFRQTLNGRAYGNGVYMSPHFTTSVGYMQPYTYSPGSPLGFTWPQSMLKVTSAISLNEVVNMPEQFVSSSPHFVVAQLDWIQTRYLFVQCNADGASLSAFNERSKPVVYYEQDPRHPAVGPSNSQVLIPMSTFSQQRRAGMKWAYASRNMASAYGKAEQYTVQQDARQPASKKTKLKGILSMNPFGKDDAKDSASIFQGQADGWASDETDHEDLEILCVIQRGTKGKEAVQTPPPSLKEPSLDTSKTDFVPGALDGSKLPLLGEPAYATMSASRALQRELKSTLQVQNSHPLHELGWYVDPNLINTVYQWIVELHSFDKKLPIAKDLRDAGLKSVVLEIRFSKDYPISPPFVRVIRPRFLGFQQGGGGHVTAGGALCMELLTNNGWSAVSSIESVLLQVRMAISSTDPKPARLSPGQSVRQNSVQDYGVGEAVEAYLRACRMHGWEVPREFDRFSREAWAPRN